MTTSTGIKNHLKRRILLGLIVFAPFGLTLYVLIRLIVFGKVVLSKPVTQLLRTILGKWTPNFLETVYNTDKGTFDWWIDFPALLVSVFLTVFVLYLIGVFSATFIGRRSIHKGERMLRRVPLAMFFYNTIKQVVEIITMPRSRAFQKVVVIEYPRRGIRGLAFFTGLTVLPDSQEVMVNVFIPTTPNPTSGFLLLMAPEEVLETNLNVSDATRFIISGGVVTLDNLETRPFPVADYLAEHGRRAKRIGAHKDSGPLPAEGGKA